MFRSALNDTKTRTDELKWKLRYWYRRLLYFLR